MNHDESLQLLNGLHRQFSSLHEGQVASYIPELSKANPDHFGIAVTGVDGKTLEAGDTRALFTLQSVSKPFVYGLALSEHGRDFVRTKVGVEPTGEAFNSIIELEEKSHRPFNPMINSGAITVASLIQGKDATERLQRLLALFAAFMGRSVQVDISVYLSEKATGHRNRAIAHLLHHFGVIGPEIESTLDLYFQQCSILADTRDLSLMAATLANGGVHPVTQQRVLPEDYVQDLLSLMFTCGMYDSSGEWAYTVGLPAKSGVSGGLLAVVPGRMGIATYSPKLDEYGHSVRGVEVFRELSKAWKLSIFNHQRNS